MVSYIIPSRLVQKVKSAVKVSGSKTDGATHRETSGLGYHAFYDNLTL